MPSLRAGFIKIYGNAFSKFIFQRGIRKLGNRNDKFSTPLISVLNSLINNDFSKDEYEKIRKIEKLRKDLIKSKDIVKYEKLLKNSSRNVRIDENVSGNRYLTAPLKRFAMIGKSGDWGLLLFKLIRKFKPRNCLELGTCLGFSAAYQACALELNNEGKIVTLEGQQSFASIAQGNFSKLDLKNAKVIVGIFQDILDNVLENVNLVDYAFIDGHHSEKATIEYFEKIYPYLSNNALLVFDDISWSSGMKRAWNTISKDKRIELSLDLFVVGICIVRRIE